MPSSRLQRQIIPSSSTSSISIVTVSSSNTKKGKTPDLSPTSNYSFGYKSLAECSIAECSNISNSPLPPEFPAHQPANQFSPRKNGFVHFQLNRTNGALKAPTPGAGSANSFRPTFINDDDDDDDIPPPPPPPRNPIPRMIIASNTTRSPKKEAAPPPPPGPLTKSSSQVKYI